VNHIDRKHTVGHAAVYCRFGWPFLSVCVYEADGEVLGSVSPPAGRYNPTARAIACLAGPLAESHYTGVGFHELAAAGSRVDVAMALDALARIGRKDFELLLAPAHALAFTQGRADRQAYEIWIASLLEGSQTKDGALYWASVRSTTKAKLGCTGPGYIGTSEQQQWANGCQMAKNMLDPTDYRRTHDNNYRAGWNSIP
jgi:hypothetical protein